MEKLNHRQRREKAKRDSRKLTCSKHTGVHLVVQGTRNICPQCYLDYQMAKKRASILENAESEKINERDEAFEKLEAKAEELQKKIDAKMSKVNYE